ncbi:MAG: hypothetical protein IJ685_09655 [Selenomonadaceae bacterium]|nr:hypothetical protein [Selenomonadaceae bacterium]
MFKKIFATILLAAVLIVVGGQTNRAEAYWGVVINCREWISLRSYRSTEAPRLATIPLGEWVWIYNNTYRDGFLEAEYNGIHGYVLEAYIRYVKE